MPVMTLPPVREMSGLNLSKCLEPSRRKVARVCERRSAHARDVPCVVRGAGVCVCARANSDSEGLCR